MQDEEDDVEVATKRHLNVVFIGHVGKLMNSQGSYIMNY